jgi:SAM-dependent methyltransferase
MKRLPFWQRPFFARRVLDIGSGHNPFQGSTCVVDFDLKEGRDRHGHTLVVPEPARLIAGDVQALPFEAHSFDYVYASHVLEHVDRPSDACREIVRVGTAGYIETPSPLLEQGLAYLGKDLPEYWMHKWFVFSPTPTVLVFEPKTRATISEFCPCSDGRFMKEFYDSLDFSAAQHCLRRKAKTTIFFWSPSFVVDVRDRTLSCDGGSAACRFRGMRRALVANCNDLWRAHRLIRLKREFPNSRIVFRKYGARTLFIH